MPDNNQNIQSIEVAINCTKKVDFLFYHHHHYNMTFKSPQTEFFLPRLEICDMVANLETVKKQIDQLADDSIVRFNYVYNDKKSADDVSNPHSTGKDAKLAFESYLRERLNGVNDKYIKDYPDLSEVKGKVVSKPNLSR